MVAVYMHMAVGFLILGVTSYCRFVHRTCLDMIPFNRTDTVLLVGGRVALGKFPMHIVPCNRRDCFFEHFSVPAL
eukprot:1536034-Amphidinium_carterae.1